MKTYSATDGMHSKTNYPAKKSISDLDVELEDNLEDQSYIKTLKHYLTELNEKNFDYVFYIAGVDIHFNDRLGKLKITDDGIRMRDEFTTALDNQSKMVSNMQEHTNKQKQNSTIKGQSGEEWVRNELLRQCPTIEIIDTHKEKEKGDFILREANMEGMIEAKAYKKNVPKKEIDKFYRDMDKNQYNYGILASLDHGVVRRSDFHLEFRNGCPIVFLHEVRENPKKLSLAIDFCKLIEKNKACIDITNEETITKIKNLIKPINAEYNCQKQLLSKFKDNMEKSILSQFDNIKGVLSLLNIDSI